MNTSPGQLYRSEPAPPELWPNHTSSAFRVWYQTAMPGTGSRLTTGTIFIPNNTPLHGGSPVLSYVHGTTGFARDIAPSQAGLSQPEREHLSHWLSAGYIVGVADYEHLPTREPHPFYISNAVATDVIDVVRAAHQLNQPLSPEWLIVGFSKGGDVAILAANIATTYAPELRFCGSAALAPIVSVTDLFDTATSDGHERMWPAVLVMLAGITASHTDATIRQCLTNKGKDLLAQASNATMSDIISATDRVTNDMAGTAGISKVSHIRRILNSLDTPVNYLNRPIFISASCGDTVACFASLLDYGVQLARTGTDVHWSGAHEGSHVAILELVFPEVLEWATRIRRQGNPMHRIPMLDHRPEN